MGTLTESDIERLAPDASAFSSARDLLRKKRFIKPGVSKDKTWLLAQCQGSGAQPYAVSVDLDSSPPTCRCTCPSRKFPCKHGLGLMLLYVQSPGQFGKQEPSEDLLAKRQKKAERDKKREESGAAGNKETAEPAARKVNVAAQTKKVAAQREGLDLLERLIVDLVSGGPWMQATRLAKLERQALQLGDAYTPAVMYAVNQLALTGRDDDLADEERNARGADLIAHLWATVQKGRTYLDGKLADESQVEADAAIEGVLGRAWKLTELREKGYYRSNLALLELAFERSDDEARQQRIEVGHLLELNQGDLLQAIAYRPWKGLDKIPEQPSYTQALQVTEAAVYPGFLNRRVRWEKGIEQPEKVTPAILARAYERSNPDFKAALDTFRQQLKHPLGPRDAVLLLRCQRIGRLGDRVALEDAAGARVEAVDRQSDYSKVANLVRAAGMFGKDRPAVLARVFLNLKSNAVVADPLAILTPQHHLRLGVS
jgi:hypothetical protein